MQSPKGGGSIKSGLAWTYLSSLLQAGLRVFVLSIMARLLDQRDFGLMGIALIFTSFAERIGQVGVSPALVQKEHLSEDDLNAGVILSVLSGLVIALSLVVIAPWVGVFFEAPEVAGVLRLLAVGFVIDGFCVTSDAILQRHLRFRDVLLAENVSYIVGNVIIGIVLAWYGLGVWALVWASLGMKVIRLGILIYFEPVPISVKGVRKGPALQLLNKGVGFSLGKVLNFLALQGDNFVVGRLLGVDPLGAYTRAYQLMSLPATYVGQALERVLFPAMAKQQGDRSKLRRTFFTSLEVMTLVGLPMSVAMFLLAREIILVLFGARWESLIPVLTTFSLGVFFRTAYKSSDTVARSLGAVYQHALRQAIYTACVIGGAFIGGRAAGLEGVAIAVVISVTVNYMLMTKLSARLLEISFKEILYAHMPGIWASLWLGAGLVVALPVVRATGVPPIIVLAVAGIFGGLIMLGGMLLAPGCARSGVVSAVLSHLRHCFRPRNDAVNPVKFF